MSDQWMQRGARGRSVVLCLATAMCGWAQAQMSTQTQPPGMSTQSVEALALQWARAAVAASPVVPGLRMEVSVGALDSRLKLAACAASEAYLAPGMRLWGSTRVGVRCTDGVTRWNVMVPTTVKAFGPAWVVKTSVPAGAVLTAADGLENEVDWAAEPAAVLPNPDAWVGQVASRALSTGQTLREGMVRAAQVFQAGATVRVLAQGPGFQISSDAQALSAGVVGQLARVRMDNGKVTSGVVLDMRTVRIDL